MEGGGGGIGDDGAVRARVEGWWGASRALMFSKRFAILLLSSERGTVKGLVEDAKPV